MAAGEQKPFKAMFGGGSEILLELGMDYQIWRGFGAVTVGGSFGFVQYIGKGRVTSGTGSAGQQSSDTTVLNLMPLRLSAGYHFVPLAEQLGVPLVPYVLGGLSYYFWWVTDGVGDVADCNQEEDCSDSGSAEARGGIFGLHLGVGLKLLLDILDQEAAGNLEREVGVINSYLFAEFALSWVNGFSSSSHMDVGDETFMFGLMMEF